jgi:hypothetical protein
MPPRLTSQVAVNGVVDQAAAVVGPDLAESTARQA